MVGAGGPVVVVVVVLPTGGDLRPKEAEMAWWRV